MKPARPYLPSALDDAEDSKPYVLAQPVREPRGRVTPQGNAALNLWRRQLGGIQKVFRKINQAAYLVSVPFLMILLLGVVAEEPADGAPRGDRGGPAQHRPARRRGRQPRRRPAPRRGQPGQDEEAGLARGRAGPDDRRGGPGVHLHPLALAAGSPPGGASPSASAPAPGNSRRRSRARSSVSSTSINSARRPSRSSRSSATRPGSSTSRSSAQAQEKLKELGPSSGGPAKTSQPGGGSP